MTESVKGVSVWLSESHVHVMPVEAIAGWKRLLGLSSNREAVAAMLSAQDSDDMVEGERNAWTPAYEQLMADTAKDLGQESESLIKPMTLSGASLAVNGINETRNALGLPTQQVSQLQTLAAYGANSDTEETISLPDTVDVDDIDAQLAELESDIEAAESEFDEGIVRMVQQATAEDKPDAV